MSIKTIDSALDFLPETATAGSENGTGIVATLAKSIEAISEGFAASRKYDELIARGVPHAKAIRLVFGMHFASK